MNDCKKIVSSGHSRAVAHSELIELMTPSTRFVQVEPRKYPGMEWDIGHKILSFTG